MPVNLGIDVAYLSPVIGAANCAIELWPPNFCGYCAVFYSSCFYSYFYSGYAPNPVGLKACYVDVPNVVYTLGLKAGCWELNEKVVCFSGAPNPEGAAFCAAAKGFAGSNFFSSFFGWAGAFMKF